MLLYTARTKIDVFMSLADCLNHKSTPKILGTLIVHHQGFVVLPFPFNELDGLFLIEDLLHHQIVTSFLFSLLSFSLLYSSFYVNYNK